MQPRILAWREIETDLFTALQHHAVRSDVKIAIVGVTRDHRIRSTGIAAAVPRPVLGNRQLIQIDLRTGPGVFIYRCLARRYLARHNTIFQLVLDATNQVQD